MTGEWLGPRALARETGVSTDTLRHYERKGLLGRVPRTTGGYRRYPPACVARVQMIQRALAIGFTLGELASVLGHRDRGGAPCRGVRTLVAERLGDLETRLTALSALREDLRRLLAEWDERLAQTPPGRQARLLDMLGARPTLDGVAAAARSAPRPRTARC